MNFFDVVPLKEKRGLCCVKHCRGKIKRSRSTHNGHFCRRCRDRRYKLRNPISYAWDKLRYSARRRHIPFELTPMEFHCFCLDEGFLERPGDGSWTIDRIKPWLGYRLDNIQPLSRAENSRKSHVDRKLMLQHVQRFGLPTEQYPVGEHPFGDG